MGKTELITDFVRVAVSGQTADGRTISPDHLKEMAETYNREKYTAQIWLEHSRWSPPFGQVVELQAIEAGDKVELFARLAPTKEMIDLNQKGQGIFTSVEITPNFADSGKAYLTGLAITDSPASLWTTALCFSRLGSKDIIVGANLPMTFNLKQESEKVNKEQVKKSFFSWLFGTEEAETKAEEHTEKFANQGNQEPKGTTEEMKNDDIQKIAAAAAVAVAQVFASQTTPAQTYAKHSAEEETGEEETVTISKAEYDELKGKAEKNDEIEERLSQLESKFSIAVNQPATVLPNGTGETAENFNIQTAV